MNYPALDRLLGTHCESITGPQNWKAGHQSAKRQRERGKVGLVGNTTLSLASPKERVLAGA